MIQPNARTDVDGTRYVIVVLDEEEKRLVDELDEHATKVGDWTEFSNYYVQRVGQFYEDRGLTRREVVETPVWKFAQDIRGRLQIAAGEALPSDYRGELERLIHNGFGSRREFCQATGISEDMLSHVLAGRKNFSINTLAEALAKVGYTLHIAPLPDTSLEVVEE